MELGRPSYRVPEPSRAAKGRLRPHILPQPPYKRRKSKADLLGECEQPWLGLKRAPLPVGFPEEDLHASLPVGLEAEVLRWPGGGGVGEGWGRVGARGLRLSGTAHARDSLSLGDGGEDFGHYLVESDAVSFALAALALRGVYVSLSHFSLAFARLRCVSDTERLSASEQLFAS